MKIIKLNLKSYTQNQIDEIVDYFKNGKVVVYPTDTIYGIGCDATNIKAIRKVFKLKQRSKSKALLILVKSWCMLKKYCYVSQKQDKYLRALWPGPVSAILKKRDILPSELTGGLESAAARMPDDEFLISIIKKLDKPIVSTSLNISGEKPVLDLNNIDKLFKDIKPDLIVDAGNLKKKKPSKIIDMQDINNIKIIRK